MEYQDSRQTINNQSNIEAHSQDYLKNSTEKSVSQKSRDFDRAKPLVQSMRQFTFDNKVKIAPNEDDSYQNVVKLPPIKGAINASNLNKFEDKNITSQTNRKSEDGLITKQEEYENDQCDDLNELDEIEIYRHNNMKRKQLGNLSLSEIKNMSPGQIQYMVQQSKMISTLDKHIKQEDEEIQENDFQDDEKKEEEDINNDRLHFMDFDPSTNDQQYNKKVFRNNYGVEFQFPCMYIQDAKVVPYDHTLVVRVTNYVIPDNQQLKINEYFTQDKPEIGKSVQFKSHKNQQLTHVFNETSEHSRHIPDNFKYGTSCLQLKKNKGEHLSELIEIQFKGDSRLEICFSPCGKYFMIAAQNKGKLYIYEVNEDIEKTLKYIQDEQEPYLTFDCSKLLKTQHKIQFDQNSNYVVAYGKFTVIIFDLSKESSNHKYSHYTIDQIKYEEILTCQVASEGILKCFVACQVKNSKSIQIWDLCTAKSVQLRESFENIIQYDIDHNRMIYFSNQVDLKKDKILVKISKNFKKVVAAIGIDCYGLTEEEDGNFTQLVIPWLNKKKINYIYENENSFLFLTHKEFDRTIEIRSSINEEIRVKFKESINPNIHFNYLDVLNSNPNDEGFGDNFVVLTARDSIFSYHVSDLQAKQSNDSFIKYNIQSMDTNWPYVALCDRFNMIYLISAYDNNLMHQITLPYEPKNFRVDKITITSDFKLYILVTNFRQKRHQILMIDLSQPDGFLDKSDKQFEIKCLVMYDQSFVDELQVNDMRVRSESTSSSFIKNQKLYIFVLHGDKIFVFNKGDNFKQGDDKKPEQIDNTISKRMIKINDDQFTYLKGAGEIDQNTNGENAHKGISLHKIQIKFSSYQSTKIFEDQGRGNTVVQQMLIDVKAQKIIVLQKNRSENRYQLIIYDQKTGKKLGYCWMKCLELIKRLKYGLLALTDGYMYYDNSVVKLRYDLILKSKFDLIQENLFINKYQKLLALNKFEKITPDMPILGVEFHRQMYLMNNQVKKQPYRLVMLPFLHERKIYLNNILPGRKYFYNIIQEKHFIDQEFRQVNYMMVLDKENNEMKFFTEAGILIQRYNFADIVQKCGQPICISPNGRIFVFQNKDDKMRVNIFELIIHHKEFLLKQAKEIDIEKNIYSYVLDLRNVAETQDEISYAYEVQKRVQTDYSKFMIQSNNSYQYKINDNKDLVVEITNNIDFDFISKFEKLIPDHERNIVHSILNYQEQILQLRTTTNTIYDENDELMSVIKLQNKISEKMNLLSTDSRLLLSKKNLGSVQQIRLHRCFEKMQGSLIYCVKGNQSIDSLISKNQVNDISNEKSSQNVQDSESDFTPTIKKRNLIRPLPSSVVTPEIKETVNPDDYDEKTKAIKENLQNQILIFTKDFPEFDLNYKPGNFIISENQLVFWGQFKFWMIQIQNELLKLPELCLFNFQIDEHSKDGLIKRVIVGPKKENRNQTIYLQIRENSQIDQILIWDIENDTQNGSFEQSNGSKIIFDSKGSGYILDGKKLLVVDQGVILKSYHYDVNLIQSLEFEVHKGFHFDDKNHNFALIGEYISFAFSYMTLVMRDQSNQNTVLTGVNTQLDIEQFNFNINKKTFLTASNFVTYDPIQLENSLKFIREQEPDLLEQLHYYYTQISRNEDDEEEIKRIAPLHLALSNNRSLNIILQYMSYVEMDMSETFRDILPKIVDNAKFIDYMSNLPFQSQEMKHKGSLTIPHAHNYPVISLQTSNVSYMDNKFCKEVLKDDPSNKKNINYAVKLSAVKINWFIGDSGKEFLQAISISQNEHLFEQPLIIAITEYLYGLHKEHILWRAVPIYVFQILFLYFRIYTQKLELEVSIVGTLDVLNILMVLYTAIVIVQIINNNGFKRTLKSIWTLLEIFYMVVLCVCSISSLLQKSGKNHFLPVTQRRTMYSALCIIIFGKLLYFLKLIETIAPLINAIEQTFYDIKWFMMCMIVIIFAIANAISLIAENQVDISQIKESDPNYPDYVSIQGAVNHVINLALGNYQTNMFEGEYYYVLMTYWYFAVFLIQIHLLNMLIAIMGDSQSRFNESKKINQIKSHLNFVIDNWWREPIEDKNQMNYLFMAFAMEDEPDDLEMINKVREEVEEMEERLDDKFQELNLRLNETSQHQTAMLKSIHAIAEKVGVQIQEDIN